MHAGIRSMRSVMTFFALAVVVLLSLVSTAKAQAPNPAPDAMDFFKNYFVTGDYVVGGVGLRGQGDPTGWATGYIYFDATHKNLAPNDAVVVAAFLYWEAIESTDQPSTMNGYFQGYPIVGVEVHASKNSPEGPNTPPCWSSGGGTGSSNGSKHLRVYRADVAPYLTMNGVYTINTPTTPSPVGFQVKLQDSGSNGAGTPLTEGASLLIVYRSLSAPFTSVVIYNGAWTMNNAFPYMSQTIQGFYEPKAGSGRLTHIVGDGQLNFGENVTISNGVDPTQTIMNPFTGSAGVSWDNVTFGVNISANAAGTVSTPLTTITTQVVPNASAQDCLSWGAVVFSAPVVDSDGDGLLDTWKYYGGYYDAKPNADGSHDHIDLPNAHPGKRDIYVQVDYLNNAGNNGELLHSHLPKQEALDKIGTAFSTNNSTNGPIYVHFDVGGNYQTTSDSFIVPTSYARGGNPIDEDGLTCTDGVTQPLCQFPGLPGVVSWKGSILYAKDQFFQHGRKDSYHYVLIGHQLGLPQFNWSVAGGSLVSIQVTSDHVATVTTSAAHGLAIGNRVSIFGAIGDYNLNGTYIIGSPTTNTFTINVPGVNVPANAGSVIFGGPFQGQTLGVAIVNGVEQVYEPNLVVSSGSPRSMSGFSDLGGGDTLVTLGLWHSDDNPTTCESNPANPLAGSKTSYCNDQVGTALVQAGTIMHELGHTLTLTHGGFDMASSTFGQNCKPSFLSIMNYLFQIHGLPNAMGPAAIDPKTGFAYPFSVDYSGQTLPSLDETNLIEANGLGMDLVTGKVPQYGTRWYGPSNYLDDLLQANGGGRYAKSYCDGTPVPVPPPPLPFPAIVKNDGATVSGTSLVAIDWNNNNVFTNVDQQDVNYNAVNGEKVLAGYNDWANVNLQQVGARRNLAAFSVDIASADIGGSGAQVVGGGAQVVGGGTDIINGGAQVVGGGAQVVGGGAQVVGGGAQVVGGGVEVDFDQANSTVDAPTNLTAALGVKSVILNWNAPGFGLIRKYYVWRADVSKVDMSKSNPPILLTKGGLSALPGATSPVPPTTFTDFTVKTNATYKYFVTAALGSDSGSSSGNQSSPSAPFVITVK